MSKIVPRGAGLERLSYTHVTKPLADVTKPNRGGRPAKFGKAMTAAERKRRQRAGR